MWVRRSGETLMAVEGAVKRDVQDMDMPLKPNVLDDIARDVSRRMALQLMFAGRWRY